MHQFSIQIGTFIISPDKNGFSVKLHDTVEQYLATVPNIRGVIDDIPRNLKALLDVRCPNAGPELVAMEAQEYLAVEQDINRPYFTLAQFFGALVWNPK